MQVGDSGFRSPVLEPASVEQRFRSLTEGRRWSPRLPLRFGLSCLLRAFRKTKDGRPKVSVLHELAVRVLRQRSAVEEASDYDVNLWGQWAVIGGHDGNLTHRRPLWELPT